MTYKFEVGKTYKTRDGRDRKVVYIHPDGRLVAVDDEDEHLIAAIRWPDGRLCRDGYNRPLDLMPPTRKVVYPARWLVRYEDGDVKYYDSEYGAKMQKKIEKGPEPVNITYLPELVVEVEDV